jgi:dienelactone hydrolase
MTVRSAEVRYEADGLPMLSQYFWDDAAAGLQPGIIVFPEIFGLADHALRQAERLAGLGFAVLAADIHGDRRLIMEMEEVQRVMGPVRADEKRIRARTNGAFDTLVQRPNVDKSKIAAIGYCYGGTMAFELARGGAAIRGAVGFHSNLSTLAPQDAKNIKGKILACIGADDPGIPPEQRAAFEQEMREGGVDWRLHLYGGVLHSFTNPDADKFGRPEFLRYDAGADKRSWTEMMSFFEEIFG